MSEEKNIDLSRKIALIKKQHIKTSHRFLLVSATSHAPSENDEALRSRFEHLLTKDIGKYKLAHPDDPFKKRLPKTDLDLKHSEEKEKEEKLVIEPSEILEDENEKKLESFLARANIKLPSTLQVKEVMEEVD